MEKETARKEKFQALLDAMSAQVEGVQAILRKSDDRTRLRLSPMVEGLGAKHRELRSLVRKLQQADDDDFDSHIRRVDGVLLDVLFLLNLVMADLLNIPRR